MEYIKLRSLDFPLRLNGLQRSAPETGINHYDNIYFYSSAPSLYLVAPYSWVDKGLAECIL